MKEGTDGGYWNNSVMSGQYSENFSGVNLTMFNHGSSGNQVNFFFRFTLPPYFSTGDQWITSLGKYSVQYVGSQNVNVPNLKIALGLI